jgi:hypothetical protein
MTAPRVWYCTHCGKQRPEQPGYERIDDRYTVVLCPSRRPPAPREAPANPTRSAFFDDAPVAPQGIPRSGVASAIEAKAIVKQRRAIAAQRAADRHVLWDGKPDPRRRRRAKAVAP